MPSPYIYIDARPYTVVFSEGEEDEQGVTTTDRSGGGVHVSIRFTPFAYISIFLSGRHI